MILTILFAISKPQRGLKEKLHGIQYWHTRVFIFITHSLTNRLVKRFESKLELTCNLETKQKTNKQENSGVLLKVPCTLPGKNLKTELHFSGKPSIHTNASRKRSFSKTLFKPGEFENAGFAL